MQKDIIENFQKMTQVMIDNFKRLGETNLMTGQKLMQEQVELTTAILEAAPCNASIATDTKDFKEVAAKQAEWAQECSKKVMESCRTSADILAEAGKAYTSMFESNMKAAASNTSEKQAGNMSERPANKSRASA